MRAALWARLGLRAGPWPLTRVRAPRGFTLLEVMVAVSILALGLMVVIQSQSVSLQNASRSKSVAITTLLARSKMVDLEQKMFHDGFVTGEQTARGTFADEGYPDIKWTYKVSEVELDLTNLLGMCESMAGSGSGGGKKGKLADAASTAGNAGNDCGNMMQSLGSLGGLLGELGRSMRAAEVVVITPDGRYEDRFVLRALLTRDDFQTLQEGDAAKNAERLESAAGLQGVPLGQAGL